MTNSPELTRTFTVAQLEEWDLPYPSSGGVFITSEHASSERWYQVHRVIFRDPTDDTTWSLLHCDPSTEHQENDWWHLYSSAEKIECKRVIAREITVTKWVDATERAFL